MNFVLLDVVKINILIRQKLACSVLIHIFIFFLLYSLNFKVTDLDPEQKPKSCNPVSCVWPGSVAGIWRRVSEKSRSKGVPVGAGFYLPWGLWLRLLLSKGQYPLSLDVSVTP